MRAALIGANRASSFLVGVQRSRSASARVHAGLGMSCRYISVDADGLRVRYGAKVESGELIDDRRQSAVVSMLSSILDRLEATTPAPEKGKKKKDLAPDMAPNGLYLHGTVGSGKSLLMDMFFDEAKSRIPHLPARRVHFHDFMASVHQAIHDRKHARKGSLGAVRDVGMEMAAKSRLLCFDEMQVTDIADAAILTQLFEGMWAAQSGCCVVSTSNRPPSELYKDGLNRHVFMPKFEALLNRNCHVVDINTADVDGDVERGTAVDYRMMGREEQGLYLHPHDERAEGLIESLFAALSEGRGSQPKVEVLSVPPGRSLTVHRSGPGSARFSFEELFLRPLGPSDYASIAKRYDCVFLSDVPAFTLASHNEARRFMNFVDILYDSGCGLVVSAAGSPDEIFKNLEEGKEGQFLDAEQHGRDGQASERNEVILKVKKEGGSSSSSSTTYIGDTEWSSTGRIGVSLSALSAVRDIQFARNRAVSRLFEMRTSGFLKSRPRCSELATALGL